MCLFQGHTLLADTKKTCPFKKNERVSQRSHSSSMFVFQSTDCVTMRVCDICLSQLKATHLFARAVLSHHPNYLYAHFE